jgi:NTE family protein
MRNYSIFLVLFFFLSFNHKVVGQLQKNPKIAIVLSGGGAKGIAHIPLLQKLDSLNIVPDLVVGTSMGSLVGGFYAMGYSGDSIASITKNANWDKLLGGKTSLRDVSVEEKSEFGRYLVDFDIKKGKIKTKMSILNDQHLREFFYGLY